MEKKFRIRQIVKNVIAICLLAVSGAIIGGTYWAYCQFGKVEFAKIIFHLREPLEGSNIDSFSQGIMWGSILAFLFPIIGFLLRKLLNKTEMIKLRIYKWELKIRLNSWNIRFVRHSFLIFLFSMVILSDYLGIPAYAKSRIQKTTLYDEYYVDPATANIVFPETKRNLIYIYMESMENTYMSVEDGGVEYAELIPEIRELQMSNINFQSSGNINGAISTYGTTWTMGGLVAQTCGIPLNMPVDGNSLGEYTDLFSGAYSLGQILEKEGYQQEFLMGSAGGFAGRDSFFIRHGNYEIKDYYYAIDEEWIPEDYFVWWGYEDEKLYEFAKTELLELSENDEPFNFTMLTVDTHFFGGYVCDLCEDEFGTDQYANVVSCASRQVYDFVLWIQEQDFYDNTTIIICGDHPTMDTDYIIASAVGDVDTYTRKVCTAVINSACDYTLDYDREFSTMDMYPTTLASLGATIEGDRLGLGTNLYSTTPTLVEELGIEKLDEELSKTSLYYENQIIYGK